MPVKTNTTITTNTENTENTENTANTVNTENTENTENTVNTVNTTENDVPSLDSRIDNIVEKITERQKEDKAMTAELKNIKKDYLKEKKAQEKAAKKGTKSTKSSDGQKKDGGFQIQQKITEELRVFLNLDEGVLICRTDVTRLITAYVREYEIWGADSKREINVWANTPPAIKLRALLTPEQGEIITWFNLQKYMARHYYKSSSTVETPPTPAPVEVKIEPPVAPVPPPKKIRSTKAKSPKSAVKATVPDSSPKVEKEQAINNKKPDVRNVVTKKIVRKGGVVRTKPRKGVAT